MKGLIIDEPWIGLILSGKKTCEMRKTACHHRGRIALIRKGSGQVVGTADVVDSLPPLDAAGDYARAEPRHYIPPGRQAKAFADGWRTPWVPANARHLSRPVSYRHPCGAVIWVNLEKDVAEAVTAQVDSTAVVESRLEPPQPNSSVLHMAPPGISPASAGIVRTVTVTGGTIRNNHLYLSHDFFPQDAIGGSNKSEPAARTISVTFIPGTTVEPDIDRTKRILRARSAVADFSERAGVREENTVAIVSRAPYRYEITKETNA